MKFLHMADLHLDSPFKNLAEREILAKKRRIDQRDAMKKIINYIKEEGIEFLFIAGDLYEQKYIKRETIEYINNLFRDIPNTKILIAPGNHDPYINNSFYKQFKWNDNVYIFKDKLEVISFEDVDVYGYGFNDFYMTSNYANPEIKNKNKFNILITHSSIDASSTLEKQYNPISSIELNNSGFDYIALGHIHKKSYNDYDGQKIVYPGSTVSLGFDELGERGVIVGQLNENGLTKEFLKIETTEFREERIDVTEIYSQEEFIQAVNEKDHKDAFYKIIMIGRRNFNIDASELIKLVNCENIIKIKDETKTKYSIEDISEQQTLKGIFARKTIEKINTTENEDEKAKLLKAFEIGMEILDK